MPTVDSRPIEIYGSTVTKSDEPTADAASDAMHDAPTIVERGNKRGTLPLALSGAAPASTESNDVRLMEVIGRGGMGEVFRGEQLGLGRAVAFKQLRDGNTKVHRERFLREAQITAQLDHPNIVPVHSLSVSSSGGVVGYAMKLVLGKTLRGLLNEAVDAYGRGESPDREHSLPARLDCFLKICDALAFAHDRGILHRDLKPANIMIGRFGEVYVMDWGVARNIGSADLRADDDPSGMAGPPDLTRVGQIIGSLPYMSPEQAAGRNVELDARSDQYSLGLILFEIVSLRRALHGDTAEEILDRATTGTKAPLEHLSNRERIAPELRAIIEKATAVAPADRYGSVVTLADDVRRFLRGESVAARPDTAVEKLLRWMSRHRRATLGVMVGILMLSGLAVAWTSYRKTVTELETRRRGDRLTALYIDAAAQAYRIDTQFQNMEEALEGLRTAAEWALTGPDPAAAAPRLFLSADFADPKLRPADFTDKTRYRWPVSIDSPVTALAPGTDRAALMPKLRRLALLRDHMADMFIFAGGETAARLSPEARRRYLLDRKSPIDYAYVALPEGVHFMLPGMDSMPQDYDVRTSTFYTMSANKHGRRWGAPYADSTTDEQGDDLVLPCTQGLWSRSGEYLGVAGVEITVTKIVETGLKLPGRPTLRTSLLDGKGRKVVDSGDANKRFKTSGKDEGLVLSDFDIPEIAQAARGGAEGLRELTHRGKRLVVVLVRLDVLGWYYVVELDPALL